MTESVSDILVARQRQFESAGVARPVAVSFGVHTVLIIVLALLPAAWFKAKANIPTMTISLGAGSMGNKRSGQLQTGGRKVEEVVEKTREPILPVTPPKAVTPDPAATVVKTPPKTSDKPATTTTAAPPKPATGAKITPGSATVETGAKGLEVGLSSAGGGGNNSAEMDSCCTEYFQDMRNRIDAVWMRNQGATGETWVDFVIEKNGAITDIRVSKSSGNTILDNAAERAVHFLKMGPLPPLYTGTKMFMTLKFPYNK